MDIDKEELDKHITGNYGEDQFISTEELELKTVAKEIYYAFCAKHNEVFAKMYEEANFKAPEVAYCFPPTWETLSQELKECWIAAAKEVY